MEMIKYWEGMQFKTWELVNIWTLSKEYPTTLIGKGEFTWWDTSMVKGFNLDIWDWITSFTTW